MPYFDSEKDFCFVYSLYDEIKGVRALAKQYLVVFFFSSFDELLICISFMFRLISLEFTYKVGLVGGS